MADDYTILQVVDLQILQGGNLLVPGKQYSVETSPSGFYFVFRRTVALVNQGVVPTVADQLATRYEQVGANPLVTDLQYVGTTTPSGQPLDQVRVYWTNADGTATGVITVNQADLGPDKTPPLVQAAVDNANAVLAT
jgi:hypothetical protein